MNTFKSDEGETMRECVISLLLRDDHEEITNILVALVAAYIDTVYAMSDKSKSLEEVYALFFTDIRSALLDNHNPMRH